MELVLIRHAQPAWAIDGRGELDPKLTESGLQQAQRLADAARTWKRPPHVLWVSTATRAQQTAAPLAEVLGLEPVVHDWLTEIRLPPHWQGAPALDISEVFAGLKARGEEEWWQGVPGGETFSDFHRRVTEGLQGALRAHGIRRSEGERPIYEVQDPELRICMVAHGGTNSVLTSEVLGLPPVPWSWERLVSAHAAITRLRSSELLGGHIFGLREHSDTGHLPPGLRSR